MTTEIKDGGPAFPHDKYTKREDGQWGVFASGGMTLRDWFAGQALNGMLAHSTRYKPAVGYSKNWHDAISQEAYDISDAMLKAREGGAS